MPNATDRGKGFFLAPPYAKEFEAFDHLPVSIQRALNYEAHENYSAIDAEQMLAGGYTAAEILEMICPRKTS